jgi:hypothetical protein
MKLNPLAISRRAEPFALALILTTAAMAQSPNLQDAHLLPGSPVVGPAAAAQKSAAIERGAASSLLVFEDSRAGDSDLFGVRLDALGAPIDALPFPITKDPGNQTEPKVAWNGQNWLVAYTNQIDPGSGYFAYQVAALRVSPQGQVLDAAPIEIAEDSSGGDFGVASDGQGWAVVFTGYSAGNSAIHARRISASGAVLDPAGVVVWPGSYYIVFGLAANSVPGEYLFTWFDNGLRGRRFDTALQPIDPAPVLLPAAPGSVAANDAHFFVAWSRETPIYTSEIVGMRLDAALKPLDPAPVAISGYASNVYHTDPRATWDGSQWIVSWLTLATQQARAARVTGGGVVLDPGGVALPDGSPNYLYDPALGALPSGGALFAWDDIRNGGALDLYGTTFSSLGAAGSERCYGIGSEALQNPRVTPGPNQHLVTFRAELADGTRILAQRVDRFGNALDVEPIEVASGPPAKLFAGGAAWNGSVYLVTWSDSQQGKVFARRLLADGTWLDAEPIFVLLGGGADVGALGSDFLVTGLRAPSYFQYVFSYGARVRGSDGAVLDNPALAIGPSFATRARVAALGGRWLVLTERHWTHDENPADLMINFVDPAGVVTPSVSAGTLNIQNWGSVDVASSGSSAIVVGQSGSNWTNTDVYYRRVLPDGSMSGPMTNATGFVALGQSRPAIAWTGAEYVLAYETYENNVWFYDYEPDVYGVRLTESGAPVDSAGFALWNGEDWEVGVEAASLGGGKALFASSTYVDGAYASYRIALREMKPEGLASYGSGTPGCDGPHEMDASAKPYYGNAAFTLLCTSAPAGSAGLLALSSAADVPGSDALGLGVLVHVGLFPPAVVALQGIFADATGLASAAAPIPGDPALLGLTVHAQAAFAWTGTCSPSPFGFSTSDGLSIQVQAP